WCWFTAIISPNPQFLPTLRLTRKWMNDKRLIIFYHILGCLAFLSLPLLFARDSIFSREIFRSVLTRRDLASYCLMIGFFYLNYYKLIPGLYFRKKYLAYTGLLAVLLL